MILQCEDVLLFKQIYNLINREYFKGVLEKAEIKLTEVEKNSKLSNFVIDHKTGNSRIEINCQIIEMMRNKTAEEKLERYAVEVAYNMVKQYEYQKGKKTSDYDAIPFENVTRYGFAVSMKNGKIDRYRADGELIKCLI